ncbi:MAG: 30S ribosomal protein S6 [Sphaerochaeta sp.]|jgi:small subunit ribosomal protein S6|uniref:30S ribosomal protein S6 n=1 Tax=Sphaerochaeta sp. TaxID=1972642 RepID=UPI002FC5E54C
MRNYEFTVIFNANEENTQAGLEFVTSLFAAAEVEITKQEDMGVKYLAYDIKKQEKGHYFYFELKADPSKILGFEREFLLHANILKYLFVNTEK